MRREYAGAARKARLATSLGGTLVDLGIVGDDLTGWPDGTGGPFFIVIGRGTATEEKILCSSRTGNSLTVYTDGLINGRGADGTSVVAHDYNDYLEHIWTATDADESNEHVNSISNVHGVTSPVVGVDDAQTLTGKTISGNANTLSNIAQSSVTGLVSKLAALDAEDVDLQAQIDALEGSKADTANPTFTGTVVLPATTSIGPVSSTEIGYVNDVTAPIQTQLNAKAPINSPTFTGDPVLPASTTIGGVTIDSITGGGMSVPPGGEENWILVKNSATDYDMDWKPASELVFIPGSGSSLIYADGSITGYDSTGTYTVGAITFRWCAWTVAGITNSLTNSVDLIGQLLVVGGGGGGGGGSQASADYAGGGGAGGLWYGDYAFGNGIHNLYIGSGGAGGTGAGVGGTGNNGSSGLHSWIDYNVGTGLGGVRCLGGGGGGGCSFSGTGGAGQTGGSGGGGGEGAVQGAGGAGTPGYGFDGSGTSGGGAAGTPTGRAFDITGSSITYATGGTAGNSEAGTAALGNGGNGAYGNIGINTGGAGGTGIIIVRYRIS